MQDPATIFTTPISWDRSLSIGVVWRSATGRSGSSCAGLWIWASENSSSETVRKAPEALQRSTTDRREGPLSADCPPYAGRICTRSVCSHPFSDSFSTLDFSH